MPPGRERSSTQRHPRDAGGHYQVIFRFGELSSFFFFPWKTMFTMEERDFSATFFDPTPKLPTAERVEQFLAEDLPPCTL